MPPTVELEQARSSASGRPALRHTVRFTWHGQKRAGSGSRMHGGSMEGLPGVADRSWLGSAQRLRQEAAARGCAVKEVPCSRRYGRHGGCGRPYDQGGAFRRQWGAVGAPRPLVRFCVLSGLAAAGRIGACCEVWARGHATRRARQSRGHAWWSMEWSAAIRRALVGGQSAPTSRVPSSVCRASDGPC